MQKALLSHYILFQSIFFWSNARMSGFLSECWYNVGIRNYELPFIATLSNYSPPGKDCRDTRKVFLSFQNPSCKGTFCHFWVSQKWHFIFGGLEFNWNLGLCMVPEIFLKLWCPTPVLDTPVFKVPFIHVLITFIIHIIDQIIPDDKICREVVNV